MNFDFEFPVTAFEKADAPDGQRRRIGGIVSLETKDRQSEVILQRGLDFGDFRRNGWFNDNHSKATTDVVGYPENVKMFRKGQLLPDGTKAPATGHWVEGYLLDNYDPADKIWTLARSLQRTNRRLGFSVEGKIQKRSGPDYRTIAKALVRNVAITNCPVHTGARLEILAKSIQVMEDAESEDIEKALAMGEATGIRPPEGPTSGEGAGQIITPQSLEQKRKQMRLLEDDDEKKKAKKSLSDTEAFAYLSTRLPNANPETIGRLIQLTKLMKRTGKI